MRLNARTAQAAFSKQRRYAILAGRRLTNYRGSVPAFIIVGAQKAGTTSLFGYLVEHPNVVPPLVKEVHFFDLNFGRGMNWYLRHFPTVEAPDITGEATPFYMFHGSALGRIRVAVPEARIIAVLRNPIDRAISHFHHNVRVGLERKRPFEDYVVRVLQESERVPGIETERERQRYSYLERGFYSDQVSECFRLFGREHVHVIRSEDLFRDPEGLLMGVQEFLGLPLSKAAHFPRLNSGTYNDISRATRRQLETLFEEDVTRLNRIVGREFRWW